MTARKGSARTYEKHSHYEARTLAENVSPSEQDKVNLQETLQKNQMLQENTTEEEFLDFQNIGSRKIIIIAE